MSDVWTKLFDVLTNFVPLLVFSIVVSTITYVVFVVILRGNVIGANDQTPLNEEFGYLLGPSYVLMTSLFGMVFGILISVLGGFGSAGANGSITASIVAGVGIVVAVVGSLFVESGKIPLRRPVGAITFLLTFVVSGLYWGTIGQ
jgi:hypothetical protein